MIISVTSPRRGMGQTTTAINLGAILTRLVQGKVLLVDMNQYCKDIEFYLSDTYITKGMDDFLSLYRSGLLSPDSFNLCVKKINANIDIMGACECFEINSDDVDILFQYISGSYNIAVVDTLSGAHASSQAIFRCSDIIVVVLNQIRNIIHLIEHYSLYESYENKILFVLNRYTDKGKDARVTYNANHVKKDLKRLGFNQPVFTLNYDIGLINECNDHTLLNFVMGSYNTPYLSQLEDIAAYIIQTRGSGIIANDSKATSGRGNLSKLLPTFLNTTRIMEDHT